MRVLLISTNRNAYPMPVIPGGLCMIAEAAERAGHKVRLLDLLFERNPARAIEAAIKTSQPDVIGLSVRNIDNNNLQNPVFYIKELESFVRVIKNATTAPIILGGASLSVMPEEILRAVNLPCAVTGPGERVFPELLVRIQEKKNWSDLPGVASLESGVYRSNPAPGFTASACCRPVYARWVDIRAYRSRLATVPLQSKLGCRFHCIYCTYGRVEGDRYRLYEPDSVAHAASRLIRSGVQDIEFVDNVFNIPYGHALSVCESIIRAQLKARFQSLELNPSSLDHDLFDAMEHAGFRAIGLTAESAADSVLSGLRKGFTSREVYAAGKLVRQHRMPCLWIFLLGGPGETRETVQETIRFAESTLRSQDAAFFNIGIRIYPGTELEAIARKEGVLRVPADKMLEPVFYMSPGLDPAWMVGELRKAMNRNMSFMSMESLGFRHLPIMNRIAYHIGINAPLWRYTSWIRRTLRGAGMDV